MGLLRELIKGLRVTGGHLFEDAVTIKYPDEFRQKLDQQNNPYSRGERRSRNR